MSSYTEKHKKYYKKNKEKIAEYGRKWNEKNKEKRKEQYNNLSEKEKQINKDRYKEYYIQNKDKYKEYYIQNKNIIKIRMKKYQQKNINIINEYNRLYKQNKRINNINFRIAEVCRSRVCIALKKNLKSKKSEELLGCSIQELKQHLEKQFKPTMSWKNWGKFGWHIDHIKPCVSFDLSKEKEQKECFHHTNLQPLWAKENHAKNSKIIEY